MNGFGWTLEHCEYIAGGWPWQILDLIHAVATVWEAAKILFCFFVRRFLVGQIFTTFEHNNVDRRRHINGRNIILEILP